MEIAVSHVHKSCPQSSLYTTPKIGSFSPTVSQKQQQQQVFMQERGLRCFHVAKLQCAKGNSVSEAESKTLMEDELRNIEEELMGIRKLNEKCKGVGGVVELLECLEREAIMGEDEGREPTDYNRRAQIFDKSSKVFQALKQTSSAD